MEENKLSYGEHSKSYLSTIEIEEWDSDLVAQDQFDLQSLNPNRRNYINIGSRSGGHGRRNSNLHCRTSDRNVCFQHSESNEQTYLGSDQKETKVKFMFLSKR